MSNSQQIKKAVFLAWGKEAGTPSFVRALNGRQGINAQMIASIETVYEQRGELGAGTPAHLAKYHTRNVGGQTIGVVSAYEGRREAQALSLVVDGHDVFFAMYGKSDKKNSALAGSLSGADLRKVADMVRRVRHTERLSDLVQAFEIKRTEKGYELAPISWQVYMRYHRTEEKQAQPTHAEVDTKEPKKKRDRLRVPPRAPRRTGVGFGSIRDSSTVVTDTPVLAITEPAPRLFDVPAADATEFEWPEPVAAILGMSEFQRVIEVDKRASVVRERVIRDAVALREARDTSDSRRCLELKARVLEHQAKMLDLDGELNALASVVAPRILDADLPAIDAAWKKSGRTPDFSPGSVVEGSQGYYQSCLTLTFAFHAANQVDFDGYLLGDVEGDVTAAYNWRPIVCATADTQRMVGIVPGSGMHPQSKNLAEYKPMRDLVPSFTDAVKAVAPGSSVVTTNTPYGSRQSGLFLG